MRLIFVMSHLRQKFFSIEFFPNYSNYIAYKFSVLSE